jgi:hypothetical protein
MMFHSNLLHDPLTLGRCKVIGAEEMSGNDQGDITTLCRKLLELEVEKYTLGLGNGDNRPPPSSVSRSSR